MAAELDLPENGDALVTVAAPPAPAGGAGAPAAGGGTGRRGNGGNGGTANVWMQAAR